MARHGLLWGKAGYRVQIAFLYGSWARGFPREDSNVDLAILFEDEGQWESSIFDFTTEISLALSKELKADVNVI